MPVACADDTLSRSLCFAVRCRIPAGPRLRQTALLNIRPSME